LPDLPPISQEVENTIRYLKLAIAICLVGYSSAEVLLNSLRLLLRSADTREKMLLAFRSFRPGSDDEVEGEPISLLEVSGIFKSKKDNKNDKDESDNNNDDNKSKVPKQADQDKAEDLHTKQVIESDDRVKGLAQHVMDELEKSHLGVTHKRFREMMVELGFSGSEIAGVLNSVESSGAYVTVEDVYRSATQSQFGVHELLSNDGSIVLILCIICLFLAFSMLMLTENHLDLLLGTGGVVIFFVICVLLSVMFARSLNKNQEGQTQINSYFSSMLEAGTAKIATMVVIVMLFAFLNFMFLRTCKDSSPTCPSNNALPVCMDSGVPPKSSICDNGNIQCYGDGNPSVLCPDEFIPGAISDQGMVASTFALSKPDVLIAATNSSLCTLGMFSALCQTAHRFTYGPPGVLVDVVNPFSNAGLGGYGTISKIAAGDRGTGCATPYTATAFADFGITDIDSVSQVPMFTPPKSSGVAIFDLCYQLNSTGSWRQLRGPTPSDPLHVVWDAQLITGDLASCTSKDCSSSDFTETMSRELFDSMYFSMVTHSTIGYGDITPTSTRGMMIVSLQAVLGMLIGLV